MNYDNPSLTLVTSEVTPGALRWRSPSNIALVKYWGKYGDQLPRNASVSFTLQGAATDTTPSPIPGPTTPTTDPTGFAARIRVFSPHA